MLQCLYVSVVAVGADADESVAAGCVHCMNVSAFVLHTDLCDLLWMPALFSNHAQFCVCCTNRSLCHSNGIRFWPKRRLNYSNHAWS